MSLLLISFHLYLEKRTGFFVGIPTKTIILLSPDEFHIKLKHRPNHNLPDVTNFSRVYLLAMNKLYS